jgi:hypothetical protein
VASGETRRWRTSKADHMSLLDRLRPEWQHSDPEVRLAALRDLPKEQQDAFAAVAREDPDPRVRRLALKRLEDPALLLEIAARDGEADLRSLASERAITRLVTTAMSDGPVEACEAAAAQLGDARDLIAVAAGARHVSVRRSALARVTDDRSLGEIARGAGDAALAMEAVRRITDPQVLRRVAVSEASAEILLAAVNRIADVDVLHVIAADRNVGKRVRQQAQTKLDGLIDDDHPIRVAERRQRQVELCTAAEELLHAADLERALTILSDIEAQWDALAARSAPTEDLAQRFQRIRGALVHEAARQDRLGAERRHWHETLEGNLAAATRLCEQIESLEGERALQELHAARTAWGRLGLLPEGHGDGLAKRFAEAGAACERRYAEWQSVDAVRVKLEALLAEADVAAADPDLSDTAATWAALEERWMALAASARAHWPAKADELRQRFIRAGERIAGRHLERREDLARERETTLEQLRELCERLETLAAANEIDTREAQRAVRAATEVARIGPLPAGESRRAWRARLSDARQRCVRRLQERKDTEEWRRWANAEVQMQLIGQIEALLATDDLASAARQLRRIQEEWKQAAVAPREQSQELWARFSAGRNEMRRRCQAFFADNLRRKEELCARAESLAESEDWAATTAALRQLQTEWKEIGPVRQRLARELWQRFRAPCNRFFERRAEHRAKLTQGHQENAARKTALCERAEAIADSTDWDAVTDELKRLQVEWKQIGSVAHEDADVLWKRFRAACDRFFERRQRRGDIELEQRLARTEAACDEIEALAASLDGNEPPETPALTERLAASLAHWGSLLAIKGDRGEAARRRFRSACQRIAATRPESLRGTSFDPAATAKRREKLCTRIEQLAAQCADGNREASLGDLAARLKHMWAANTIGGAAGRSTDWRAIAAELERLRAGWDRLGPALDAASEAMTDRFDGACARLDALRPKASEPSRRPRPRTP